jgi:phospholipid-binding lipoprotein MlaA
LIDMLRTLFKFHCILFMLLLLASCSSSKHVQTDLQGPGKNGESAAATGPSAAQQASQENLPGFEELEEEAVADPIEPWNRAMFTFNDRLYFWLMKPVLKVYNGASPEGARRSVRNFFYNIEMPVRLVSSLIQAQLKAAGIELARFTINSTIGVGGLFDVAESAFKLDPQEKDIGQTLGKYGMQEGFYIVWPLVGPSTVRDTLGTIGDTCLSPWRIIFPPSAAITLGALSIGGYDYLNKASLDASNYEELVNAAVEPYAALKNAFVQQQVAAAGIRGFIFHATA